MMHSFNINLGRFICLIFGGFKFEDTDGTMFQLGELGVCNTNII